MPANRAKTSDSETRDQYRLELVGFKTGERPSIVVQAVNRKKAVIHSAAVSADGLFVLPADILKAAHQIVLGYPDDKGNVAADGAVRYRAGEFAAVSKEGTLALAEGIS